MQPCCLYVQSVSAEEDSRGRYMTQCGGMQQMLHMCKLQGAKVWECVSGPFGCPTGAAAHPVNNRNYYRLARTSIGIHVDQASHIQQAHARCFRRNRPCNDARQALNSSPSFSTQAHAALEGHAHAGNMAGAPLFGVAAGLPAAAQPCTTSVLASWEGAGSAQLKGVWRRCHLLDYHGSGAAHTPLSAPRARR